MSNYIAEVQGNLLSVQFKGRPTRYEVIISTQEALVTLSENSFTKSIVDTRRLEILFPMSLSWFRNTWYPKAVASGLKSLAIVVPEDFMRDIGKDANPLQGAYEPDSGIDIRFFTDFEEALTWVRNNDVYSAVS